MISVIFSTYNGEQTLPLMLESFIEIDKPEGGWELIAVNNNSTDNTHEVLNKYRDKLPIKIHFEKNQGKNNALNSVLNQISGEIIVFTDDDVIPEKNWLTRIEQTTLVNKQYSIFGGRIKAYWHHEPDLWNEQWISSGIVYGISPDDLIEGEVSHSYIWGGNMAIRSDIIKMGYRFDSNIGPNGTSTYKMGSETSFTGRLVEDGYLCWYDPSCIVKHIIKKEQMTIDWVLERSIRFGKGQAARNLQFSLKKNSKTFFSIPRYLYSELIVFYFVYYKSILIKDEENKFKSKWGINYLKGLISELKRIN